MRKKTILKSLVLLVFFSFLNVYFIINKSFTLFQYSITNSKNCECEDLVTTLQENVDSYKPDPENIQTYDLLDKLTITYQSFIWTHTGWKVNYRVLKKSSETINVHVVPFSHNDAGWLSTPDQYYRMFSSGILDTALQKLKETSNYTFVWSEVWFIKRWYHSLNPENQKLFKHLLSEGRFEILTGSMIMVDEATSHYTAIIDQLQHGQKWLRNTLNLTVDTAWSLDSFGHSAALTKMLSQSDIKYLYIQRTHYALKQHLNLQKAAEFLWKNSLDAEFLHGEISKAGTLRGHDTPVFTHMSPSTFYSTSYSCGPDFAACCQFDFNKHRCWQYGKYVMPQDITLDNIHEKATLLSDQLRSKNSLVRHNEVLFLVGDDFSFDSSADWDNQFRKLDSLFVYINNLKKDFNLNIKYSTIGKYLKAAKSGIKRKEKSEGKIPSLIGDFYPYSDRGDQYWSGLYTTRPHLKLLIRKSFSYLRTAELLVSYGWLKALKEDKEELRLEARNFMKQCGRELEKLKDDMSLYNHHDTITGTSKQHVVDSLYRDLATNLNRVHQLVLSLLSYLYLATTVTLSSVLEYEAVEPLQQQVFIDALPKRLLLFNPLLHNRTSVLTMVLDGNFTNVAVESSQPGGSQHLRCQLRRLSGSPGRLEITFELPATHLSATIVIIRNLNSSKHDHSCGVVIEKTYDEEKKSFSNIDESFYVSGVAGDEDDHDNHFHIKNDFYKLLFCACTKVLKGVIIKKEGLFKKEEALRAESHFSSFKTGNRFKPFNDKSGAYIFLPLQHSSTIASHNVTLKLSLGPVKSSVTMEYSPNLRQTISLLHSVSNVSRGVIIDTFVDIRPYRNFEISLKVNTGAGNVFYTDSNGLQMMRRKYRQKMTLQGNFYPITSLVYVQADSKHRLNFISNRCHGVSVQKGSLEMMLDRRLQQDDWRGLNEGVLDNKPLHTRVLLVPEEVAEDYGAKKAELPSSLVNEASLMYNNPPIALAFNNDTNTVNGIPNGFNNPSLIPSSLPRGIFLISLKVLKRKASEIRFLVTLHNTNNDQVSVGADGDLISKTEVISAQAFFPAHSISSVHESNLIGTSTLQRLPDALLSIRSTQLKSWIITVLVRHSADEDDDDTV